MNVSRDWLDMLKEFHQTVELRAGHILVVGCSTSEVAGEHIGTAGSVQIAEAIYKELNTLRQETGIELAFQCCEHLNRALVVEEEVACRYQLEVVSAVPVREAGGSMAAHAYQQMEHPVLVESIAAHAGIDIGDTLIGMHLKRVAVPVRLSRHQLGQAHVTFAKTRPKLIGGQRAVYTKS
ncbi:TIGR01440 family protein [Bacillus sp. 179-C3.3 HS]|uniref:TIGR01440 family protein n=1 Tax=Bacillus sp. 179-C3.3 HS TaxID=3232162 RepID=UPI0039A1E1F5